MTKDVISTEVTKHDANGNIISRSYDLTNGWSAAFIAPHGMARALHLTHTSGRSMIVPPESVTRLHAIFTEVDAQLKATFRD